MNVYISLLRGINVGSSKILSMNALCGIYSGLGFTHVRTYLQSGNVIFQSPQVDLSLLVQHIESIIEHTVGYHVPVFIRQPKDFQHIIVSNPFPNQTEEDPRKVHVSFLYQAPTEVAWSKLVVPDNIPDKLERADSEIYLYYPNGYAKTKISTGYLEKILGVPITNRNWNTVSALYKLGLES